MATILHITAHMGGGVGRIISGICEFSENHTHKLILLEEPEKLFFLELCNRKGIKIIINPNVDELKKEIEESDIVQLEWWNHPLMSKLLRSFPDIKCRLVIWSHISGCTYPHIPFEFLKIPSRFIFTSEYSYENPLWSLEEKQWVKLNVSVINSYADFTKFKNVDLKKHNGFNIGYIGTLKYSKINPEIYEFYKKIDIHDYKIIMVGDLSENVIIDKIIFKNYVDDVIEEFRYFDIFSYILNKEHFGTTENVLLEAMAIGLPVIALNQSTEKYIIENNKTGILVNTKQEYADAVKYLYENPKERSRLGEAAKKYVFENCLLKNTIQKLDEVYIDLLREKKNIYCFESLMENYPNEWFLKFTGKYKINFENDDLSNIPHIFYEENKSSVSHFYKYYSNDKKIKFWYEKLCNL